MSLHSEAWDLIKDGVDLLLAPSTVKSLSAVGFMNCYTEIINYCTKQEPDSTQYSVDVININIGGKDMYYLLKKHVEEFLAGVVQEAPNDEMGLLTFYAAKWSEFARSASVIHNLFNYLNRMWIKRKLDEQIAGIYDINTVSHCLTYSFV